MVTIPFPDFWPRAMTKDFCIPGLSGFMEKCDGNIGCWRGDVPSRNTKPPVKIVANGEPSQLFHEWPTFQRHGFACLSHLFGQRELTALDHFRSNWAAVWRSGGESSLNVWSHNVSTSTSWRAWTECCFLKLKKTQTQEPMLKFYEQRRAPQSRQACHSTTWQQCCWTTRRAVVACQWVQSLEKHQVQVRSNWKRTVSKNAVSMNAVGSVLHCRSMSSFNEEYLEKDVF